MMIRLSVLVFFIPSILFASGSSGSVPNASGPGSKPFSIVDSYQRRVDFEGIPQTIVSLSPGITETVYALGYGERLVGRSEYCDYPPQAESLPALGSIMEPNIEMITAISPDLVLGSTHFSKSALEKLEATGQKVVVLMGQDSFEGVYKSIIMPVSRILGDTGSGERLVASMRATVEAADARVASFSRRPSAYYVIGFGEGGDWTAGGDTFLGQMLEMAGTRNIAAELEGWSYSLESLVDADPDIIFVPDWAIDVFPNSPIYRELRAVRLGNVFVIDEDALSRQGPRMAEAYASLVDIVAAVATEEYTPDMAEDQQVE